MAEKTGVWVRTATLDFIVYGKVRSTNVRSIPGTSFEETDDNVRNWGWARAEIINSDSSSLTADAMATTLNAGKVKEIKVYIRDEDSSHDRNEIVLPGSSIAEGNVLMANIYGHGEDDEDDDEGDDYYDEYGGGGNEDVGDKYPDDLIILTHLHEPSVVYCLKKRYSYDKIYTATGPILIAINPFKNCNSLYSDAVMKQYWNRGERRMHGGGDSGPSPTKGNTILASDETQNNLPPHVYGMADHSYRTMMNMLEDKRSAQKINGVKSLGRKRVKNATSQNCNQSILVSGESGAGKTVTTKFIMQYLATLSKRSVEDGNRRRRSITSGGEKVDIEQQVLQSNPILESFGNARTIRNDNSSRFGKYIEIQFTEGGALIGASIETYLLEKVRLVSQTDGERNYHIFYELLQGMDEQELEKYFLTEYTAEDFNMTNQSGTFDRRDGVSDYETYQNLKLAMETMGLTCTEQEEIMTVTCALLHGSNMTFNSVTADECEIDRSNVHVIPAISLLGVSAESINRALCYFSITAGREKHLRSLSKEKSEKGLLALIKATYGALFSHIVRRVNQSIASEKSNLKGRRQDGQAVIAACIGVLDIFGFESFRFNSFEQLCINYCNEALQQQFNLFVLKNEQEEYDREGIQWNFISFPDNQNVLDLIDKKGAGILNILDDQCRAPGTTDKTFCNDLYQKLSRHSRFQADFRQVGAKKFAIIHYAGTVEYSSEGFVEKNRDELPKEATDLLLSSSNKFVKHLADILNGLAVSTNGTQRGNRNRSTVGGQFSRQLHELRKKIDETAPHYVRCLKPNDELIPDFFDTVVIADQLRCAGVIEAVRVSRVGYPQRYTHAMFVARYRILGSKSLKQAARSSRRRKPVDVIVQTIAEKVVALSRKPSFIEKTSKKSDTIDLASVGIQVGKTKVFLRRKAYEILEGLRNRQIRVAAIKIQSTARRHIIEREFKETQNAIITIQNQARIVLAKRFVNEKRRYYNATLIETTYRKFVIQRKYVRIVLCTRWVQRVFRGRKGRYLYKALNKQRKSIVIQSFWRLNRVRSVFQKKKRAIIIIQCALRCRTARKLFRKFRAEERDVHALHAEIQKLKKALGEASSRASQHDTIKELTNELDSLQNKLQQLYVEKEMEKNRANEAFANVTVAVEKVDSLEHKNHKLLQEKAELASLCALKDKEKLASLHEVDDLKAKIDFSSKQNDVYLEKEIKEVSKEVISLRNENSVLKKDLLQEKIKLKTANELGERRESQASAFLEEIKILELEVKRGVEFREENVYLNETSDSLRAELETLSNTLTSRQKEFSSCLEEIESLKTDLQNAAVEKDIEKQRGESMKKEFKQFREENINLKAAETENPQPRNTKVSNASADIPTDFVKIYQRNEELQNEVIRLNGELEENCRKYNQVTALNGEIETLYKQKESLEENISTLDRNITIQRKASAEFDELIHDEISPTLINITQRRSSSPMFSIGTESDDGQDGEVMLLEAKIKKLKQKLDESQKTDLKEAELKREVECMRKDLFDSKESAAGEILTLQDEVQCLNNELRATKEMSTSNPRNNQNVSKLIDSNIAKDEEIKELRQEILNLRDQLELGGTQSVFSDCPTAFQNGFDDDRSVVSKIFTRTPLSPRSLQPHQSINDDQDYIAVRKINENLRKEVELSKKRCEDYKMLLKKEEEKSKKEIESFGEALKGVDELRQAAVDMSREITRFKKSTEQLNNNEADDNFNSAEVLHRVKKANRAIDISSLKSEEKNIWGKLRHSFLSSSERGIDCNVEETVDPTRDTAKRKKKRRGKKRDNDDASIWTAFF